MVMKEINIRRKEPLGSGTVHTVYNFEKFKDKVIKTKYGDLEYTNGKLERVNTNKLDQNEMQTFVNNPEIFAKVYKYTDRYAIIEKLDTQNLLNDVQEKVAPAIVKTFIQNPELASEWTSKKPIEMTSQDFDGAGMLNAFRNHKQFVKGVLKNTPDREFVIKLLKLINNAYNEIPRHVVDIHENNLGYDKEGNIKLLDF